MLRLAATVMLVRPCADDFEVYMLRRSEASHFVPDVYVFPGGTLDDADFSPRAFARTQGIGEAELRKQYRAVAAPGLEAPPAVPAAQEAAGLLIAAIRELFEEAGVLLACDDAGRPLGAPDLARHAAALQHLRAQLHAGATDFAGVLETIGAYADARALALFSQWITPPVYPRRYNAHFYTAVAPEGQLAAADAFETHDGIWIRPRTALERCRTGDFRMVYPTIKHVERLARFSSVHDVMRFAREKTIYTIMPRTPAEREFSLPPDLEYAW